MVKDKQRNLITKCFEDINYVLKILDNIIDISNFENNKNDILNYMKDYKVRWRNSRSLLSNLGKWGIKGNDRKSTKRDALEWIAKSFSDAEHYMGLSKQQGEWYLYYLSMYSSSGNNGLSSDQSEFLNRKLDSISYQVLSLMKEAGFDITIFKNIHSDLQNEYSRKTVTELIRGLEYKKDELLNKIKFYFKEGSYYYLYSVSKKYFKQIEQLMQFLGIAYKVI